MSCLVFLFWWAYRGDDFGELTENADLRWPKNPEVAEMKSNKEKPYHLGKGLADTQKSLFLAGRLLVAAEHVYMFTTKLADADCDKPPKNVCAGLVWILNPIHVACSIAAITAHIVGYGLLVAATISYEVWDSKFEMDTLGPNEAMHGYEYSQQTYIDAKHFNK